MFATQAGVPAKRKSAASLARTPRLLGQMRLDKLAPRHRAGPEPRGEPVEKLGERMGALGLVRALELGLGRRERLGREAGEAHEVDADSRRRWRLRPDWPASRR